MATITARGATVQDTSRHGKSSGVYGGVKGVWCGVRERAGEGLYDVKGDDKLCLTGG